MSEEEKNLKHTDEPNKAVSETEDNIWPGFDWKEGFASWDTDAVERMEQSAIPEEEETNLEPKPEVTDPAPETRKPARRKKRTVRTLPESILAAMLYVAGVLVISFVFATVGWSWANDFLALDKPDQTVSVTISEGETIQELADELESSGLIQYKFLFKLFAGVTGKGEQITSGTYTLTSEMDYSALLNNISSTSVTRETATVTIPEGFTVKEIFQLLEDSGITTVEELNKSAEEDSFDYSFLNDIERTGASKLEGYLFPDTYEFYKGADAKSVIAKMLSNFTERFDEELEAELGSSGYSLDEIIIIASIIEKETTGEDQRDISSVIYNRLTDPDHDDIAGRLQMDSTVQYVLPERKERLTDEDIAIDSPYNTYVVTGLPEGPICNPGLTAIEAALKPNQTDYYYFMLGNDGNDHFFNSGSSFYAFKAQQAAEAETAE